jgi:hypothetical protein
MREKRPRVAAVRNFKSNGRGEKFMQMMSKTEQLVASSGVMLGKAGNLVTVPPQQQAKFLNPPARGAAPEHGFALRALAFLRKPQDANTRCK